MKIDTFSVPESIKYQRHFAFCAMIALHIARADKKVSSTYSENIFLIRWLKVAIKKKIFPKYISEDISWLLEKSEKNVASVKLAEYFIRTYKQTTDGYSEIIRLAMVTDDLKNIGWKHGILGPEEWRCGYANFIERKWFLIEEDELRNAFDSKGELVNKISFYISGEVEKFISTLESRGFNVETLQKRDGIDVVVISPH